MGKPKRKWTDEEVEALRAGVKKHGLGNWKKILNDPILCNRSNVDLKDKSRNLKLTTANPKGEWSSEEKKAILDGVEKHGRKWKKIFGDQEFAATLTGRNNMDVKHKWLELSENQIGPKATGDQAEVSSACGEADGSPTTIGSQNDASSGAKANDGLPNSTGARANGGSPNSNGGQADGSHTASAKAVLFGCGTCKKTAWTLDRISIHRAVDHTETRTCISCSIEFATPQLFHDHVCQKACSFV